jgi:hypothetical protein
MQFAIFATLCCKNICLFLQEIYKIVVQRHHVKFSLPNHYENLENNKLKPLRRVFLKDVLKLVHGHTAALE